MSDDIAISSAYSGPEAIRYLDSMVTEAVMLDILMPRGDAFRILRFLGVHQNGMTIAPLQSIRKPGSASKIEQPWFATLPLDEKTILRADLQALLGKKGKKQGQQALVVRSAESLAPNAAKKTVGRALEALGLSILRLNSTAEALAAVHENKGNIATVILDLTFENESADEQALQLIEALGSEAFTNRHNLPIVLLLCEGYLLACCWPEENSFQHHYFQELVDKDRHRVWLALQMAN
jgi:CheY-like chemotaxis protein